MYFPKERMEQTLNVLEKYIYSQSILIDKIGFADRTFSVEDTSFSKKLEDYIPFTNGGEWKGKDTHALFRLDIIVPKEFDGKPIVLYITTGRESGWEALNPQFIVWTEKGLKQGIDVNHREVLLDECADAEKRYKVLLEGWSGLEAMSCFFQVEMMSINREVEALYYDLLTAKDIIFMQKQDVTNQTKMLTAVMPIINSISLYKVPSKEFYTSISEAHLMMKKNFFEALSGNDVSVYCTGHAHIDVAWQWTVRHSRKKAVRSFSSAIDNMDQYEDFIFSSSQPQLYSFIKQDYPEFYNKIKQKMKENKFEAEGAMWVEADCNLISGESFVRQLVHGKRFFKQEFGVDSKVLWLPDVFGYSAAMPQLLKLSGVDYFVTSKISWNEYNRMPHDIFYWEGIDGSKIFTYLHTMPDADNSDPNSYFATYNGQIKPHTIAKTWDNFKDKELTNNVLASYGFGDGGGGPTRRDLEYARRLKHGMPGVPCVKTTKILPFLENLEKEVAGKSRIPKWSGELYLEFHRGTYTSIASIKKYNRKCEIALHDLELVATMSKLWSALTNYPFKEIDRMWEVVLLNQFHDILPGSSIGEVYQNSYSEYEEVLGTSTALMNELLLEQTGDNAVSETMTVFNMLPFVRSDVLVFEEDCKSLSIPNHSNQIVQKTYDGNFIAWVPDVPSMGYITVNRSNEECNYMENKLFVNETKMENSFFKIEFDESLQIASIYDKLSGREVLTDRGNVLRVYEDRPREYDAWEITSYYRDKEMIINNVSSFRVLERGPVRVGVEIVRAFLDSVITQRIFVYSDLPRIDFDTEVEWNEKQLLLKTGFPLAIHSDFATFDIAFGNLRRATHSNTSWDYAKFEVCAHKWADMSERGYGVALLNDCKYGYRAKDGMLEITLLKSASFPYKDADTGKHSFCYSLFPHSGDFAEGKVEYQAWMLNSKLLWNNYGMGNDLSRSLFSMHDNNIFIDVVKCSYDGQGVIIRIHEFEGRRTVSKLLSDRVIKNAMLCDLLENNLEQLEFEMNEVYLEVKPYEIKTIKLFFEGEN